MADSELCGHTPRPDGRGDSKGKRKGRMRKSKGERAGSGADKLFADGELGLANGSGPQQGNGSPEAAGYRNAAKPASFWSDAIALKCRDGKTRLIPRPTIEPVFQSLVDGLSDRMGIGWRDIAKAAEKFPLAERCPNRVGMLRGAGNAIVPEVAAEVIKAYMEYSSKLQVPGSQVDKGNS